MQEGTLLSTCGSFERQSLLGSLLRSELFFHTDVQVRVIAQREQTCLESQDSSFSDFPRGTHLLPHETGCTDLLSFLCFSGACGSPAQSWCLSHHNSLSRPSPAPRPLSTIKTHLYLGLFLRTLCSPHASMAIEK